MADKETRRLRAEVKKLKSQIAKQDKVRKTAKKALSLKQVKRLESSLLALAGKDKRLKLNIKKLAKNYVVSGHHRGQNGHDDDDDE